MISSIDLKKDFVSADMFCIENIKLNMFSKRHIEMIFH